jgi:C4-dicarboxylate transporter DctM subunit
MGMASTLESEFVFEAEVLVGSPQELGKTGQGARRIIPVITALGFDPIWFGVIIVMTVELGLIHPPVGMNVFVIKSVVKDVKISTIFMGVIPFVITDIVRLGILIAFPILATYLPSKM